MITTDDMQKLIDGDWINSVTVDFIAGALCPYPDDRSRSLWMDGFAATFQGQSRPIVADPIYLEGWQVCDRCLTPAQFETETVAVISTGHISEKDLALFQGMIGEVIPSPPFICLEYDRGVWVRTFWETPEEREADIDVALNMGISVEAVRLIRDVAEAGFTWAKFDSDGPTYEKYKVFNWR